MPPSIPAPPIAPDNLRFTDVIHPAGMWSHVLKRHCTLRLTDLEGGANVGALFYNFELPSERYNMPDTLKAQHTAKLTRGHVLYSDMGRILCSITGDSTGWHDPIGGTSDAAAVLAQYGPGSFGEMRNRFHRNGRDNFLIELGKYGMGRRDLVANVNFFSKLQADAEGRLHLVPGHGGAGAWVDLRAEMNTLVILQTCPHPYDTSAVYAPKRVGVEIFSSEPPGADDFCRNFREENRRGFQNTERYFL